VATMGAESAVYDCLVCQGGDSYRSSGRGGDASRKGVAAVGGGASDRSNSVIDMQTILSAKVLTKFQSNLVLVQLERIVSCPSVLTTPRPRLTNSRLQYTIRHNHPSRGWGTSRLLGVSKAGCEPSQSDFRLDRTQ